MTNFYTFHLNDQALQIKDSEIVLDSSPGIACLLKGRIISGLEARPLLSKHPSLISTEHWYKINQSETSIQSKYKITNADLVYSQLVKMWSKLTKKKPVILVGNKSDTCKNREVSEAEAIAKAEEIDCEYIECSAKDGTNLEEIFNKVIQIIYDKIQDGSMDPKTTNGIKINPKMEHFYLYKEKDPEPKCCTIL